MGGCEGRKCMTEIHTHNPQTTKAGVPPIIEYNAELSANNNRLECLNSEMQHCTEIRNGVIYQSHLPYAGITGPEFLYLAT